MSGDPGHRIFGKGAASHQPRPPNKIRVPELEDYYYGVTMRFRPSPAAGVNIIVAQIAEQFLTSIEDRDPVTGRWVSGWGSGKTHPSLIEAQKVAMGHIRSELLRESIKTVAPTVQETPK